MKKVSLRVGAETKEQFQAAVCNDAVELIYIESAFFAPAQYEELCKEAKRAGKGIGLRLPQIWRSEAERFFDGALPSLQKAGFDALLVRNMEGLLHFTEQGFLRTEGGQEKTGISEIVLDYTIYDFNEEGELLLKEALSEVQSAKPCADLFAGEQNLPESQNGSQAALKIVQTLPLELNKRELCALSKSLQRPAELLIYGRYPMMVSAQCIRKTTLHCDRKPTVMMLSDRTGAKLPVKNHCAFCFNTIYNAVPTVLFDLCKELSELSLEHVRLDFTTETEKEAEAVIRAAAHSLGLTDGGRKESAKLPAFLKDGFTRGHFKRGVE